MVAEGLRDCEDCVGCIGDRSLDFGVEFRVLGSDKSGKRFGAYRSVERSIIGVAD